ncbi:rhodanese-like domain-containing protein [Telmatocola sphagniphila]|uniref:Rhodanese-like domain-containing protein n=1 Tax=Telmatocola sphagniphila TaxID=1123043 RepID=A0A8E6BBV0_9BACT|nr:rhodanese-like domain-containing protein [Telmatocola sphagniphila]
MKPRELADLIANGENLYLVDVRQPWENEHCRIANSVLIPLNELIEHMGEIDPPEGAKIVVYCHHGIRSLTGATLIQQAGFQNVASLSGGIDAWSKQIDPKVPLY